MSHIGSGVEKALHCLLFLVDPGEEGIPSARDLAEFQGVSPSFVAKLFTKLEKFGIVQSDEGVAGGFRLGRPASTISVLDVVDAIEGKKPLFRCRDIRRNCVLFNNDPPKSATRGVCAIHGVMIEAERRMRGALAEVSLQALAEQSTAKLPNALLSATDNWFKTRQAERRRPGGRGPKPVGRGRQGNA